MIIKENHVTLKIEELENGEYIEYVEIIIPKYKRGINKRELHIIKIDIEDLPLILNKSVTIKESKTNGRVTNYYVAVQNEQLHRVVKNDELENDLVVDHINGNGLDNRKLNLRVCTKYQNHLNKSIIYFDDKTEKKQVRYMKKIKNNKYIVQFPSFYWWEKKNNIIKVRVYNDFKTAISDLLEYLYKESRGYSRRLKSSEIDVIEHILNCD